jgi:hypothetical protein
MHFSGTWSAAGRQRGARVACASVGLLVAGKCADPDRPALDAVDGEDRAEPRIVGEALAHVFFAYGRDNEQRRPVVRIAERSAENDDALFGEKVDEGGMLIPRGLFATPP